MTIIDISKSAIVDSLSSINTGEGGYTAFITSDGTELYPDGTSSVSDTVFTETEFYQAALASEEETGEKYVEWQGETYLFLYSLLPFNNAMVCTLIPRSTIIAQVSGIKTLTILIVIIAILIASLLGSFMSGHINKNIYLIFHQLQKISDGDLTDQLNVKAKDEFKLLAEGVNSMILSMKDLITNITAASNALTNSAQQVSSSAETFVETSKDIQNAISDIESGASNLDTKQNLTESAKKTAEMTMNVISAIEALSEKSRSIGQIIESIDNIAEETNLLSLNASIEAARAGEGGRGFAVVAEQIRKLAEQSSASTGQIQHIIDDIIYNTEEVVQIARETSATVSSQEEY